MRYLIIFFIFCLPLSIIANDNLISPFNKMKIELKDSNAYSFIVSGHFYGNKYNNTGLPTHTILANLDWVNKSKTNMVMLLGDLFMDINNDKSLYEQSLFSKLKKPIFNSVGNHDLTGNVYQNNYGATYYYFILNNTIHLILDSELNDGDIKGEQLKLLNKVESLITAKNISTVFVYSHRTLWARAYSDLDKLFLTNTQSKFSNNFKSDVLPILDKIQETTKVIWFSGSIGDAPASFFNYTSKSGIQYVATAIRGYKRDALLLVNVNNGKVSYELKSLTNQKLKSFDDYNLDFWNKNIGKSEPFNYKLLPLYIKQMLLSYIFWIGLSIGLLLAFLIYKIRRRKSK